MSRGGGAGGRNRSSGVTVLANALGIQRGEIINQSVSQPPPLFPPLDCKPVPLSTSDDHNYMVALKNEFLNRMRESAYFLKEAEPKKDVERYSDKYRNAAVEPWTPYYDRLPKELWPKHLLVGDGNASGSRPAKKRKVETKAADASFAKKFETLEKREMQKKPAADEGEEEVKKKRGDDEEEEDGERKEEEQEMSDEDYQEEDNDYIQNYFDNGDNYLDDSEENVDDEAYY